MKQALRNGLTSLLTAGAVVFGSASLDGYLSNDYQGQSRAVYAQDKKKNLKEDLNNKKIRKFLEIDSFNKKLKEEISPLLPSIDEFILTADKFFEEKIPKIMKNPKAVQDNKYYTQFTKEFDYYYENPNKKGFLEALDLGQSISDSINNIKKGNLKKPSEADKAALFALWIYDKKFNKIENKLLLADILKKSKEKLIIYQSNFLDEIEGKFLNTTYIADYPINFNAVKKNKKGETKVDLNKLLGSNNYQFFVADSYEDKNKDGIPSIDEFNTINFNKPYFLKNERLILGIYNKKFDKVRKGMIEFYSPEGKKILNSRFNINDKIEKGEIPLEKMVDKNGPGTYTSIFSVEGFLLHAHQIEVRP